MWCQPADKGEFCGNYEPISMQGNKFGTVKRCSDLITIGHKKTKKNIAEVINQALRVDISTRNVLDYF